MKKLITIGLSPNVEWDDACLALRVLMQPWKYRHGQVADKLANCLQRTLGTPHQVYLFNSGRSALLSFLQTLQLEPTAEVLLQAFTCNAVANPILWSNLKPVYVDIENDESYTMSATDLEKKITPLSKVVIIQHTFGQAADLEKVLAIARAHHLIVIEDCAHALGTTYHGQVVGTFGDAAIFSFGRDKVISSVYGGALVINNKKYYKGIEQLFQTLPYPKVSWIFQQLLHPPLTYCAMHFWYWGNLGRALFWLAQKIGILSLAVSRRERSGQKPSYFPARLPDALASLALHQWYKLDRFNAHRSQIAALYQAHLKPNQPLAESIYLRYTWRTSDSKKIVTRCAKSGIILGDWYWQVIVPSVTDLKIFGYIKNSCPIAERTVNKCVNLPTHINITPQIAQMIIAHI